MKVLYLRCFHFSLNTSFFFLFVFFKIENTVWRNNFQKFLGMVLPKVYVRQTLAIIKLLLFFPEMPK